MSLSQPCLRPVSTGIRYQSNLSLIEEGAAGETGSTKPTFKTFRSWQQAVVVLLLVTVLSLAGWRWLKPVPLPGLLAASKHNTGDSSLSARPSRTGNAVPPAAAAKPEPVAIALPDGWKWDDYHTLQHYEQILELLSKALPHAKLYPIGVSAKNRQLWVLQLGPVAHGHHASHGQGSTPSNFIPAVKLVAGMHGDEPASMELLLRFAWELVAGWATDERITALLATTAVHILPVANPDGFIANERYTANHVDLNRNFPLDHFNYEVPDKPSTADGAAVQQWRLSGGGPGPPQPETLAIMSWAHHVPAVMSANAHGGALVANYPLDACDSKGVVAPCPTNEEPLPHFVASAYAAAHKEMWSNTAEGFENGTTNGARWYPVIGSMQDWLWHNTACMDITLELHSDKHPSATWLPTMWEDNRNALLRFAELAHMGVHVRVTDESGRFPPLQVEVVDSKGNTRPTKATTLPGHMYKLLAPGQQYCLKITPLPHAGQTKGFEAVLLAVALNATTDEVLAGLSPQHLTLQVDVTAQPRGSGQKGTVVVAGRGSAASCPGVAPRSASFHKRLKGMEHRGREHAMAAA